MSIRKILEKHGFTVEGSRGNWTIQQYTPEGEDWFIMVKSLKEIKEYAENYSRKKTLICGGRPGNLSQASHNLRLISGRTNCGSRKS